MISLFKPGTAPVNKFLKKSKNGSFSYKELGRSKEKDIVKGYDNDFNRIQIGEGEQVFQAACTVIRNWQMFPGGWAYIEPAHAPIKVGQNVAMVARVMGVYFISDCRIVYIVDEEKPVRRYGFAYGTLGQHVEKGEELFSIEMLQDGSVWYLSLIHI